MPGTALNTILYVEDDPDIRTVAQIALEIVGGFSLRSCSSGNNALEAVASSFVPDLLLLDVMMPDMDGPATLAALRQMPSTAATPAVFMTAKVQASEIAHYKALGAIGVIAKPFDPLQLADQVRELWEHRND
jgi:two-component system OmpR family response regulator